MSRPDASAASALVNEQYIRPVIFAYMDIVGDVVRANNSGSTVAVSGTGKPDLDGTYDGVTADFGDVSPVTVSDGGSGTVTFKLSGLLEYDAEMMATLSNRANWAGRTVRLWRLIRDRDNVDRGTFQHFYTGYMVDVVYGGSPGNQWIEVSAENYLVAFSAPSNRTYLSQSEYDPGDQSARAAIASANGANDNVTGGSGGGGSSSGGGGGGGGMLGASMYSVQDR